MPEVLVCKRYIRVAFSQTGPKEAIFTRLRCKQWSCPACAAKNASIWRAFLAKKLPEVSSEWWLMTLTANPETRTMKLSLLNIRSRIDRLIKRMTRVFGRMEYVRVYEKHPTSDAIHVHFIVTGVSPYVAMGCSAKLQPVAIACTTRRSHNGVWAVKSWLKKTSWEVGMGYIADIRLMADNPITAMWYVTKYLTKEQQAFHEKGLRHVQTTRGIGSPKPEKEREWNTAAYIVASMFPPNTAIEDLNTGATIDNNYWEVHNFYPYED